jgi:predicted glycoside hydrolase/deacetylase ChbG (UPF0249 family)
MVDRMPRPMPMMLCADDYGLAPGVSRAICNLIEKGCLSATTCMVGGPFWVEHAAWLKPLAGEIDVGLHLTMTDQVATGPLPKLAPSGRLPSLTRLLKLAYAGGLDASEIEAELTRQFDLFEAVWQAPPDFCDGHQHIHQLPVIGSIVLRLAQERLSGRGYVRNCVETLGRMAARRVCFQKAMIISLLGWRFKQNLGKHSLPTNNGFSGVYDIFGHNPYCTIFPRFLLNPRPKMLVICHPGFVDDELVARDTMTHTRADEYAFLAGLRFLECLDERGLRLSRFLPAT